MIAKLLRLLFIIIALVLVGLIIQKYLNFDTVRHYYMPIKEWTMDHFWLSLLLYIVIYAILTVFAVPGMSLVTILSGFLFGLFFGTVATVIGASLGVLGLYMIVSKTEFTKAITQDYVNAYLPKIKKGIEKDGFFYMLLLRLLPIFPFFAVNILAPLSGIRCFDYMMATFFGIIPGTLAFVSIGKGFENIILMGKTPGLSVFLGQEFILGVSIVGIISIAVYFYKKREASKD